MASSPSRTPLVISFSGPLRLLVRGKITLKDLDEAIFFFSSRTRESTADEELVLSNLNDMTFYSPEHRRQAYLDLWACVTNAERGERVAWQDEEESDKWKQLNELLTQNGLSGIVPVDPDHDSMYRYCLPAVRTAVREQALPYIVIDF